MVEITLSGQAARQIAAKHHLRIGVTAFGRGTEPALRGRAVTRYIMTAGVERLHLYPHDLQLVNFSDSASEVRGLIEGIAGRMREVSAGTEDYAAAAEEIAAAAQQLNASTEEISSSATHLADAAERLTGAVGGFKLS
jgi:hypothetical protein